MCVPRFYQGATHLIRLGSDDVTKPPPGDTELLKIVDEADGLCVTCAHWEYSVGVGHPQSPSHLPPPAAPRTPVHSAVDLHARCMRDAMCAHVNPTPTITHICTHTTMCCQVWVRACRGRPRSRVGSGCARIAVPGARPDLGGPDQGSAPPVAHLPPPGGVRASLCGSWVSMLCWCWVPLCQPVLCNRVR